MKDTKKEKIAQIVKTIMFVIKVIIYEAMIILVACGFLYLTNFRVEIKPNVQIISPEGGK